MGPGKPEPPGVLVAWYADVKLSGTWLANLRWRAKRQWRKWFPG